jgi:ubiquinone/menaquinone biosynthesis C-methylase UbiE
VDQVAGTQHEGTPGRVGRGRRAGRRLFDVWSRVYDAPAAQRLIYRPVQDAVVAHLDTADGIVDLGCGTGLLTRRLAEQHPRAAVVVCDLSWGMLQQAAGTPSGARWVQGDAQALPLATGSADVVVCTESFHWYPNQGVALAEIRRVLRPGGCLLVAFVNPRAAVMARAASAVAAAVGPPARWWTRRQLAALVDAAGFDVDEQTTVRRIGALVLPTVLTVATRR